MRGKVEICGINTADLKVLKNDEMVALLKRSRNGDQYAREQLICGNLRLVLSVLQLSGPRRERGRSFSGRLHRSHQGHRPV